MNKIKQLFSLMAKIPKDKLLHFFWGAILSAPPIYFLEAGFGFFLAVVIVIVKEMYDSRTKGNVELLDVVFGLIPAILLLLMKLNF